MDDALKTFEEISGTPREVISLCPLYVNFTEDPHQTSRNVLDSLSKIIRTLLTSEDPFVKAYAVSNFSNSFDYQNEKSTIIARPDGIFKDGKFKCIEMNVSPSVGGLLIVSQLQQFYTNSKQATNSVVKRTS